MMGIFDGLPVPPDKAYLREELSKIPKSWAATRFDSLPDVVRILTSKDREGEIQYLKEQSDVIEDVVDEVVQAYHSGFNKAIQNYSQILRLFSESAASVSMLKVDLAEAKRRLGTRNKQLHQLWYRSVTLRHIISLLDQIEGIAKVPARIEKLINEKQFYAAVQLHRHSSLMLEREGLQTVGAAQDIQSELSKLLGVIFNKTLDELHVHLYNRGEFSSVASNMDVRDDELPTTTTAVALTMSNSQSLARRTRPGDGSYRLGSIDGGSFDGHDEDGTLASHDEANGGDGNIKCGLHQIPWLSSSSPDEFIEAIRKSDAPLHVKYLQTLIECLSKIGKVAAAGAILCQRLRPTIHEIIASKIKAHAEIVSTSRSDISQVARTAGKSLHFVKGQLESYQLSKQKRQNGISLAGTILAVSPVSPMMAPTGKAQAAVKELLDSILDTVVRIFENHVVVGELMELKSAQNVETKPTKAKKLWNSKPDAEASQIAGGYSIGFSLTVLQSECQKLICEVLRATPEAASADTAQTARLASKAPSKDKKDGSEDGLTFAFRFTDATISIPNQGVDAIRQGWSRKGPNVLQEGYGSATVLPEQGIYLVASVYQPVLEFTDKVSSMLPKKYPHLGNDGLLAFVENFIKDHFLPAMFVDYRKSIQAAISRKYVKIYHYQMTNLSQVHKGPAAFRPRSHTGGTYPPSVEKGRPVLQGLLAIDFLAKEVFGWAQAMPKFANDLVKYVQTFLERAYERCRTSYMEAVLEKQSYMLIGRHDVEKLMQLDPSSACILNHAGQSNVIFNASGSESVEFELELNELLLNLSPIKQENLIRDDKKLILLASLSDSLEYVADSIERLGETTLRASNQVEKGKSLASFADDYRKLAIDCLKVLRMEMQLETIFHMQEMSNREYLEDQDTEEPDDFIISLTAQVKRRDEEVAPFVAEVKRNYIFGGICSIAAQASMKALADMKALNLFGVQQICRNSIALEQALAAIPSIDGEAVQQRLDRVRTYYELLNMPFEALLAFITEHQHLFTATEYFNLLKVQVPGREIPPDAQPRLSDTLSQ